MSYYHDLITQKSWLELQQLKKICNFTLIGGWAVYFYTLALKSKDIDIIINYDQLENLKHKYSLTKNDRLKKYEAVLGQVQIDIYLPHYSFLGIPAEDIIKHNADIEGFNLIDIDYLTASKMYTLSQRGRTPKGQKDLIDIISLISQSKFQQVSLHKVKDILQKNKLLKVLNYFQEFLNENFDIPQLNLNKHQFAQIKKEIKQNLYASQKK